MRAAAVTLCALLAAGGAAAQQPEGARPGNTIGTGMSLPRSDTASNINEQTTRSPLAPSLPSPPAGDDIQTLLLDARQSLEAGRTGQAQEALERAETRALDRSVPAGTERDPATGPVVRAAVSARQALAAGNIEAAIRIITEALPNAAAADLPR